MVWPNLWESNWRIGHPTQCWNVGFLIVMSRRRQHSILNISPPIPSFPSVYNILFNSINLPFFQTSHQLPTPGTGSIKNLLTHVILLQPVSFLHLKIHRHSLLRNSIHFIDRKIRVWHRYNQKVSRLVSTSINWLVPKPVSWLLLSPHLDMALPLVDVGRRAYADRFQGFAYYTTLAVRFNRFGGYLKVVFRSKTLNWFRSLNFLSLFFFHLVARHRKSTL